MKILLDECVHHKVRAELPGHSVFTVAYMKWTGVRNGALMKLAVENDFECLLTIDKSIPDQHNLTALPLALLVVRTGGSEWLFLSPLMPRVRDALSVLQPRTVVIIE